MKFALHGILTPSQEEVEELLKPAFQKAFIFGLLSIAFLYYTIVTHSKK